MSIADPNVTADVRAWMTVDQKARWAKGFPAAHTFGESRYTVGREGNEWYAYVNRLGMFFVSTTPQFVFDAIQNDMNNNNVTGALIHLKTGTITNVNITLDRNNTILQGEGWQTFLAGTAGGHCITITADGCVVRDLGCRSQGVGNNTDAIYITGGNARIHNVWIWQSDRHGINDAGYNTFIENCYIQTIDNNGINLAGSDAQVNHNYITTCSGYGIYVTTGGDGSMLADNHIYLTTNDSIEIHSGADQCMVTDNYMTNWGYLGGLREPLDNNAVNTVAMRNNCGGNVCNSKGCCFDTISGAVAHLDNRAAPWGAGRGTVWIPAGTYHENVTLQNQEIHLVGLGGVIISGYWELSGATTPSGYFPAVIRIYGSACSVRNLTVWGSLGAGHNADCIEISGATNCFLLNLRLYNADMHGVHIYSSGTYSAHRIDDCVIGPCDNAGILADACGVIIGKNVITEAGSFGIQIASGGVGGGCIITGNWIDGTTDDGILLSGSNNTVTSNRIGNWTNEAIDDNAVNTVNVGNNTA